MTVTVYIHSSIWNSLQFSNGNIVCADGPVCSARCWALIINNFLSDSDDIDGYACRRLDGCHIRIVIYHTRGVERTEHFSRLIPISVSPPYSQCILQFLPGLRNRPTIV